MSVHIWLVGACALAVILGLVGDIEEGEYGRATAVVLCAVFWPVSLSLGFGGVVRDLAKAAIALLRRLA